MRSRLVAGLVGTLAMWATGNAHAVGLDLSLSNESAYIVFLTDSGSLGYGGADVGFGFFYNEAGDGLLTGNIMVVGTLGERRDWQFGVGAKAYAGQLDVEEDIFAIAVGGQARYVIPSKTPVGFVLEGYYAPSITSFADTDNLGEFNGRVEVEILPSTRGYVGYRYINTNTKNEGDVVVDDTWIIGIRLQF